MNLAQLEKTVKSIAGRRSMLIQGPPGSGKSSVIKKIHDDLNMDFFFDLRLGVRDPVEVKGIQIPDVAQRITINTLPDYIPRNKDAYGILLLDEFDHATPATQSAAYQIMLDHKVGEFDIPENVWVLAACNSAVDGGVHFKIPRPIKNRVVQVFAKASVEEWIQHAVASGLSNYIVSFIRTLPDFLYFEKPEDNQMRGSMQAFATPRSWFALEDVLDGTDEFLEDEDLLKEVAIGTVGYTAATKFLEYVNTTSSAVEAEVVLEGRFDEIPSELFTNNNALHFMMTSIESHYNQHPSELKKTQQGVLEFISKIDDTALKAAFFKNFTNKKYERTLTPNKSEKDAHQLRDKIITNVGNLLLG